MNRETKWIKAALARNPAKTQSGLAKALGIDKSSVSRLLRGERRLKFVEARVAADYLGVEPPFGFSEDADEFEYPDAASPAGMQRTAPLFHAATSEDEFWRLDRRTVIERKLRGPQLYGIPSVFGFYAPDDAMAPRFKIGEVAWVNPMRPVAPGDDALLLSKTKDDAELEIVLLGELQASLKDRYQVRQHSREKSREFNCKAWGALYVFPRA